MALQLDLNKSAQALQLNLQKRAGIDIPPAEVAFDLDVSGSYDDEHRNGLTTELMARLVPWGVVFDPDKKLDVFTFSSDRDGAHYAGEVTVENYQDFIARKVIRKVPGYGGGTDYAHVLRKNLEHFGWVSESKPKGGIFGFGRKETPPVQQQGRKALVLFNTDGDNFDKNETYELFQEMERERYGVYVMFIAASNQGGQFKFIQKLADDFDNCGITVVRDIAKWARLSDEELTDQLITDELIAWVKS